MPQQHIAHHEDQRDRQLNLQLVEGGDSPLAEVLCLVRQQDAEHHDSVEVQRVSPEVNVLERRVVQLIDEHNLVDEDGEHQEELEGGRELLLEHVAEDDDLVEQDHLREVRSGLVRLLLRDRVEELLLSFAQLEREQVARPLNEVVQLILRLVLNDDTVVQVEVVVEAEHVHGLIINLVRPVALIVADILTIITLEVPVLVRQLLFNIKAAPKLVLITRVNA